MHYLWKHKIVPTSMLPIAMVSFSVLVIAAFMLHFMLAISNSRGAI